jgi:MOSC domain-containing protein YiiM
VEPHDVGHVLSVNVGLPRVCEWQGRRVKTSIWKAPVAGRVAVRDVNVDGDRQSDLRVHGGADKAVYAYAAEDYEWWSSRLGYDLEPGTFGENLTIAGLDIGTTVIGTHWHVGTCRLQVAQPRLPCFKLGMRMGDASFVDEFERAERFGAYLRILAEGSVGAGDSVHQVAPPDADIEVRELGRADHAAPPELVARVLRDPYVPASWKRWARRRGRSG